MVIVLLLALAIPPSTVETDAVMRAEIARQNSVVALVDDYGAAIGTMKEILESEALETHNGKGNLKKAIAELEKSLHKYVESFTDDERHRQVMLDRMSRSVRPHLMGGGGLIPPPLPARKQAD